MTASPLSDIKNCVEHHTTLGFKPHQIRIRYSKYNELLKFANCDNEQQLRKVYYDIFGVELPEIIILED